MTCAISGNVKRPDGTAHADATFKITRNPVGVGAQEGSLIVPRLQTVTTNGTGVVSFNLAAGNYRAWDAENNIVFDFGVPDQPTADWADCVAAAEIANLASVPSSFVKMTGGGTAQDYAGWATRAAFVSWAADKTPAVGTVIEVAGVTFRYTASGTVISDLPGYVPNGQTTDDHFNGDISAMRAYLDGLTNTEHGVIRGTATHAIPILSDADRSASVAGTTRMGNLNEPGSITEYTGTGNGKTIASATNANPAVFGIAAHGFTAGERVWAKDVAGGTWAAALNGGPWLVAGVATNTFTLTNDLGTAFNGTSLGTLTGGTIRNEGAMGGWVLGGSFMQDYSGLTMRTTQPVESIVTINAENFVDSTDFSGSITRFSGIQFAPKTNDVTDAQVVIENHKFATFDNCWWIRGVNGAPAMRIGAQRDQSPLTLLAGAAVHTVIEDAFIFSNIAVEHAELLTFDNCQFDSTSFPVGITVSGKGVASEVTIRNSSFINDGGADGSGLAAVNQAAMDMTSPSLNFTSGWHIEGVMFRDWPIGARLDGGGAKVSRSNFRGRQAGDIGIVIGENAVGESIGVENNFLQMVANGNQGILDLRYKAVTITGATQANPVVVTCSGGHHFNAGDRVRITAVGGMTQINDKEFIVTSPTATTFQLYSVDDNGATSAAVNGTAYGVYTSGGSVTRPYHWHKQNVGGVMLSLGHGSMVFDLALDQLATLAAGVNNVLTMGGVPFVGGHYEVCYSSTINMLAVTGTVKFSVSIGAIGAPAELFSAFEHTGAADQEIHHSFRKVIYIPGQINPSGEIVRLRIEAPGVIYARGKASGTLGQTFMQIRKVS